MSMERMKEAGEELAGREIYGVCFPDRDGAECLHDDLAQARERFFSRGRKAVRVRKSEVVKGYEGKLRGKVSRWGCYWKKSAGKTVLEEAFDQKNGYVIVRRSFENVIVSRISFDKSHAWQKAEYYDPEEPAVAAVLFKPNPLTGGLERFDWVRGEKHYRVVRLEGLPYASGSAEQSVLAARCGQPDLILSTDKGELCFCTEESAKARRQAMEELKDGTVVMMAAWEVKDGTLPGEDKPLEQDPETETAPTPDPDPETEGSTDEAEPVSAEENDVGTDGSADDSPQEEAVPEKDASEKEAGETDVPEEMAELSARWVPEEREETELDEIAEKIIAAQTAASAEEPVETEDEPEAEPSADAIDAEDEPEPPADTETGSEEISPQEDEQSAEPIEEEAPAPEQQEDAVPSPEPVPDNPETGEDAQDEAPQEEYALASESGANGQVVRTAQDNGLTVYQGETAEGKRQGFGAHYDRNGALSYAGFWAQDKKDGLGVSFREEDHALHVSAWQQGKPGELVSLFDPDGRLRHSGRIVNGRKEGVGISFDEDGNVFVGKWENGRPTGFGSLFDREGNLLYTGHWADGQRSGHGTEFDRNGAVVFDGEWQNDKYRNGILYQMRRDGTEQE